MILQALTRLAEREHLLGDPDYEAKPVAWLIRIDRDGRFLGIEGTHEVRETKPGKTKQFAKKYRVPKERGRASGARAFFLYDKAEYVFGVDPSKDDQGQRSQEKLAQRWALFRQKVEDCFARTKDAGVGAVVSFLNGLGDDRAHLLPEGCASNDLFAFVYDPDIDQLVTDRDAVREYWRTLRCSPESDADATGKASNDAAEATCLVTGEVCSPVEHFGHVQLVGGQSSGAGIVSFNKSAYESYGWKRFENAPVSREAAEAVVVALKRLLEREYPNPDDMDSFLPRRQFLISSDTTVCYWADEETPESGDVFCNQLEALFQVNPEQVAETYKAMWKGRAPEMDADAPFFALTLTGAQGRVIVRDWFESNLKRVTSNIARYFEDLDLDRGKSKDDGASLGPIPLGNLTSSLATRGSGKEIPSMLAAGLFRAGIEGSPFPFSLLQRALTRIRAEMGDSSPGHRRHFDARVALIKAVLNRKRRFHPETSRYGEVRREMDPKNENAGYRLGRLMAVIERMQTEALGSVNATVVDRYFSGASANPVSAFPRLMKGFRHHVRKVKDDEKKRKTAFWLERIADEILEPLPGFPAHLSIEDQGLFVIGYHHQRSWMWKPKAERDGDENVHDGE